MKIDTIFKPKDKNAVTRYAGSLSKGKLTGFLIRDDVLSGSEKTVAGEVVAKFLQPVELDSGDAVPMYADVMVEGAVSAVGLGQYLRAVSEQKAAAGHAKTADDDEADG